MNPLLLRCAGILAFALVSASAASFPRSDGQVTFTTRDMNDAATQLWRVQTTAGAVPERINAPLDALALFPGRHFGPITVSADGAWYVFGSERFDAANSPAQGGYSGLTIARADFTAAEAIRYTNQGGAFVTVHHEGIPVVASGGNTVVFVGAGPQHVNDLYRVDRQAGGWTTPVLLTAASTNAYNYWPALSADGSKVIFNAGGVSFPGESLCEVRLDGTGFRTVITKDGGPPGMASGPAVHSPSYAPDGSVVFEAEWGGGEYVWRLPAGGGSPVKVQPAFGNDNSPTVLPDGRVASLLEGAVHRVKVMDLDGGSGIVLTTNPSALFNDVADIGIGSGALWRPSLDIEPTGGFMHLLWPLRYTNLALQASTALSMSGGWTNLLTGTNSTTVPATNAARFFRLVP